ncbi:1725_t:CDS:2 [Diversispora eburnea]|uniref:1725_t:CDS:1 n=1 Tax=Diversispora eburnea TaxID=1213867 RepID=A0A9N9C8V4_9GLOM|nr:1725_t:CDS:2 [Diversispora eburnea]
MSINFMKYFALLLFIVLALLTSTNPDIPSQTKTISSITCSSCKVDTSVDTKFQDFIVTPATSNSEPDSIFPTITPSTFEIGSNKIISYKTTTFFSAITIIRPGYTTTFLTTQYMIIASTEVYIPPSTVVVSKEVTATIPYNDSYNKPLSEDPGTTVD